ncbi:hypothetical protein EYF80_004967 [Liparis tanakae]|uniref:Uncharacterized protein n=1 Tax=Liparis tanakae TaxID=230148 RepID=A0A4Z2J5Z9_9TELE|nr:hypothetical protein EYF80_004967 [Liparis tanakae]
MMGERGKRRLGSFGFVVQLGYFRAETTRHMHSLDEANTKDERLAIVVLPHPLTSTPLRPSLYCTPFRSASVRLFKVDPSGDQPI